MEYVRADASEREAINRIIFDELVNGVFTVEAVACFQRVIDRMKREGCDAVILGCTEVDSTRLLARAAFQRAVQDSPVT